MTDINICGEDDVDQWSLYFKAIKGLPKYNTLYLFAGCELEPVSATQSSTLWTNQPTPTNPNPNQLLYGAANCIDGVIKPVKRSICHTSNTATPWIAIDYGTSVTVQRVEIFNRHDCCGSRTQNVDVRISNELPTSGIQMFSGGTLLGHFAGPGTNGQHIIISGQTQL